MTYHRLKQRVKLSEQAMLDSLTNLPNRRLLHERMEATFAYSKRFHKMMAILAIDVDYFKNINDTYGHDFGDEILKIVGNGIKATLRGSDTVSRIGGDEFIAVLKEFKTIDNVHAVARKLTTVFAEPWVVKEEQIEIHLSIGISIFDPEHPVSLKQLSKEADIALYKAKADGRNRYCFYKNEQI